MSDQENKEPLFVTSKTKREALALALVNEYRAELCRDDQPALRECFLINAKFLREISKCSTG
jgi:hypothetical protein